MSKKMLIDATHHEETRVAIVEDGRLEEFDYESTFRKALKGNIFLAKVTRVEPSLQAAFVNFGGNRHGFLPFSEIHPDYFRIPIADREALLAEQEAEMQAMEDDEDLDIDPEEGEIEVVDDEKDTIDEVGGETSEESPTDSADEEPEDPNDEVLNNEDITEDDESDDVDGNKAEEDPEDDDENNGNRRRRYPRRGGRGRGRGGNRNAAHRSNQTEKYENMDDEQRFRFKMRRKYKIQEVIKRGQIMLVQVSKEERGNKGAAVGSYLSLPGRYCVLMPNSPRAGGVSRKISNYKDRAKMRELLKDLEVPKGMSVILRTAGVTRTKTEVKRDLEYLMRLWNNIRELTLESSAPALVYEEANLVKRAVRDLYTRDVEEIHVSGDEGFKTAKDFMKMLIPSHVKRVIEYKDQKTPLFQKFGIEQQISEIGETTVTLKSGGYLVINPTEALVSIDVNSGKATKERHIEETALKTNLEAAEEVARQLRLRDLGGLVVVDFIDMEDRRNNGKVERRMREALSGDRARIQVGRISSFGLMEMSRQRMNPSLTESQFETCSHCEGTGRTRTADAASIMLLRAIEEEAAKGRAAQVIVHVSNNVALYLLNQKRNHLSEIESRYDMHILIRVDDGMSAAGFRIEVSKPVEKNSNTDDEDDNEENKNNQRASNNQEGDDDGKGRRRGRRGGRRRGGRGRDRDQNSDETNNQQESSTKAIDNDEQNEKPKKSSNSKKTEKAEEAVTEEKPVEKGETPKKKPATRGRKKKEDDAEKSKEKSDTPKSETKKSSSKPAAKKVTEKKAAAASNDDKPEEEKPLTSKAPKKDATPKEYETVNEAPKSKKKGWWSRGKE